MTSARRDFESAKNEFSVQKHVQDQVSVQQVDIQRELVQLEELKRTIRPFSSKAQFHVIEADLIAAVRNIRSQFRNEIVTWNETQMIEMSRRYLEQSKLKCVEVAEMQVEIQRLREFQSKSHNLQIEIETLRQMVQAEESKTIEVGSQFGGTTRIFEANVNTALNSKAKLYGEVAIYRGLMGAQATYTEGYASHHTTGQFHMAASPVYMPPPASRTLYDDRHTEQSKYLLTRSSQDIMQ
jgi:hypothetical protein